MHVSPATPNVLWLKAGKQRWEAGRDPMAFCPEHRRGHDPEAAEHLQGRPQVRMWLSVSVRTKLMAGYEIFTGGGGVSRRAATVKIVGNSFFFLGDTDGALTPDLTLPDFTASSAWAGVVPTDGSWKYLS